MDKAFQVVEKLVMSKLALTMLTNGDVQDFFSRWEKLDGKVRAEFKKAGVGAKKGRPRAEVDVVKLRQRHDELLVALRSHDSVPYRQRRYGNAGYRCIVQAGLMKEFGVSRATLYRLGFGLTKKSVT